MSIYPEEIWLWVDPNNPSHHVTGQVQMLKEEHKYIREDVVKERIRRAKSYQRDECTNVVHDYLCELGIPKGIVSRVSEACLTAIEEDDEDTQ